MKTNETLSVPLPCPFCGCKAITEVTVCDSSVRCDKCRALILRVNPSSGTALQQSIQAWNKRENSDTERLEWLMSMGYSPAKWRPWTPGDRQTRNGMVFLGNGTREEIDAAMARQRERDAANIPVTPTTHPVMQHPPSPLR